MGPGAPSPEQLLADAAAALQQGDRARALSLLSAAEAAAPFDPHVKMQKALVYRISGALPAALATLDEALALDPYNFLALLSKGAVTERLSGERAAARIYENAIRLAPSEENLPPNLKAPLARARQVVAETRTALAAFLAEQVGPVAAAGSELAQGRLAEAIDIYAGVKTAYVHEPLLLHYPRLPAIPFYPRDLFPWLPELEAATPAIQPPGENRQHGETARHRKRHDIGADIAQAAHMVRQFLAVLRRPALFVARLHQQGHQPLDLAQLGDQVLFFPVDEQYETFDFHLQHVLAPSSLVSVQFLRQHTRQ